MKEEVRRIRELTNFHFIFSHRGESAATFTSVWPADGKWLSSSIITLSTFYSTQNNCILTQLSVIYYLDFITQASPGYVKHM